MKTDKKTRLRRGWTTGACATAATKAALAALWGEGFAREVSITLPRGETPVFPLKFTAAGAGWAEVGIVKDAGDDPDVTHGLEIRARVEEHGTGIRFAAGEGVGTVTKPGLPLAVGEPAINPVPREMMGVVVEEMAAVYGRAANVRITISIPGGCEVAKKTWNGRLGIKGGLSVLGTTGIVRPFSCSAWIASIHRGVDVARALGERHVAACTGATSEAAVAALYGLPEHAMLDMGDFAGGVLKYLRGHPVERLTIGGGIGKITKLAQGAIDLHSSRSQVDFAALNTVAQRVGARDVSQANTALEALEIGGVALADGVAKDALNKVMEYVKNGIQHTDIVIVSRDGEIITRAGL